jgi:hypothetical protein
VSIICCPAHAPGKVKPVTIIYEEMPPGTKLSTDMPDWVKIEIADCIIVFGRLEQCVIEIAWEMAGTTEIKARLKRARQPATDNFDEVLSVIEEAAGEKLEALRRAFEELAKDRNLMAHGSWLMAGSRPYVIWHKFLTDVDSIMGEFLDTHRFQHFKARANKLLETCNEWYMEMTEKTGRKPSILNKISQKDSQG